MSLRALSLTLLLASASPALAAGQAISVTVSYSLQMPATGETDTAVTDQEKSLKRALYERAARECEDLRATIALTCQIVSINMSAQVTRNPGTPAQIYVSSNVQMQISAK